VALKAKDRCDACGAQARYRAYFWTGDLLFCGHHYRQNQEAISEQALGISNETGEFV
jgi:hypothetical protein